MKDSLFEIPENKKICTHCSGYGSSLKDPIGVNTCTKCKGSGLILKDKDELCQSYNNSEPPHSAT